MGRLSDNRTLRYKNEIPEHITVKGKVQRSRLSSILYISGVRVITANKKCDISKGKTVDLI